MKNKGFSEDLSPENRLIESSRNLARGAPGPHLIPDRQLQRLTEGRLSATASYVEALERLRALPRVAELVLANTKGAKERFQNLVSGYPTVRARGAGPLQGLMGLIALVSELGDGEPIFPPEEFESIRARIIVLQAAWKLDQREKRDDLPMLQSAHAAILDANRKLKNGGSEGGRWRRIPGDRGPGPVPDPADPDQGHEVPESFGYGSDLADLVAGLFVDWAFVATTDRFICMVDSVEPDCVSYSDLGTKDENGQEFVARPGSDSRERFPEKKPDNVALIFGIHDLTENISSWTPNAITFYVPSGAVSGSLYLQGPLEPGPGRTAGHVLGKLEELFGDLGKIRALPKQTISIVYPPVISLFRVNGTNATQETIEIDSCSEFSVSWLVSFEHDPGQALRKCAELDISLHRDQSPLASGLPAEGNHRVRLPDDATGEITLRLKATVRVDGQIVGTQAEAVANLNVVRRLSLRLVFPQVKDDPPVVPMNYRDGWFEVVLPCPATSPIEPTVTSSNTGVINPHRVWPIYADEQSRVFRAEFKRAGDATITVRAHGHELASLMVRVVEANTAIVLSGGGAKGSFEVGALSYLIRHQWDSLGVTAVIGTSVGAINAIALAENEGLPTAEKLERIWLELRRNSDMWTPATWLGDLADDLDDLLSGRTPLEPEESSVGRVVGGVLSFGLSELVRGASWVIEKIDLLSNLASAVGDFNEDNPPQFLFDLLPIRNRIAAVIDRQKILNNGVKLRLCAVALEDGLVYYITEDGQLIRDPRIAEAAGPLNARILPPPPPSMWAAVPPTAWPAGYLDPQARILIAGAMGSAAIPAFFPPEYLTTTDGVTRTFIDGGVREVEPVGAAVDLGSRLIVNISAGKRPPNAWPDNVNSVSDIQAAAAAADPPNAVTTKTTRNKDLLAIAFRGIDLCVSEVERTDRRQAELECFGVEHIDIFPLGEVHDTRQIAPGLIRINMAYGYMRAFDVFFERDQNRRELIGQNDIHAEERCTPEEAYAFTEEIRDLRERIFRQEIQIMRRMATLRRLILAHPQIQFADNFLAPLSVFTSTELTDIRMMKRELYDLVEQRWRCLGADSLPTIFGSVRHGEKTLIYEWWEEWETRLSTFPGLPPLPESPFFPQQFWIVSGSTEDILEAIVTAFGQFFDLGELRDTLISAEGAPGVPAPSIDPLFRASISVP